MSQPAAGCFIVDIDGTLVDVAPFLHHVRGPGPKDFDAFHRETNAHGEPVAWVVSLVQALVEQTGMTPVVLTGRPAAHAPDTKAAVDRYLSVPYMGPITRADGDNRPDHQVKRELVGALVAQGWGPVRGAIDDRPQVLALWRELGLDPVVVLREDWEAAGEHYSAADREAWRRQETIRRHHGWRPDEEMELRR